MRSALIPARLRRHRPVARPDPDGQRSADEREPRAGGLVCLVLVSDQRSGDRAAWRRGRRVLLDVDKMMAATSPATYRVRGLPSRPGPAGSELRPAGGLSRRHLRWSDSGPDLPRTLALVRTIMKRDRSALERSALLVARPAIVFFAVEPPLADAITAEEHGELAREASITWVVPENSAGLMSAVFAADGARILTDHHAVTDEVVHLLRTEATGAAGAAGAADATGAAGAAGAADATGAAGAAEAQPGPPRSALRA